MADLPFHAIRKLGICMLFQTTTIERLALTVVILTHTIECKLT